VTATSALDVLCVSLAEMMGRRLGVPPAKICLAWDANAKRYLRWDAEAVVGAARFTASAPTPHAALRALAAKVRELTGGGE
jgi:hypothetical protein